MNFVIIATSHEFEKLLQAHVNKNICHQKAGRLVDTNSAQTNIKGTYFDMILRSYDLGTIQYSISARAVFTKFG